MVASASTSPKWFFTAQDSGSWGTKSAGLGTVTCMEECRPAFGGLRHLTVSGPHNDRATYLLDAQNKAVQLFEEIERDLVRPGISEKTLSDEIHQLGAKRHGVGTHWHKRVIRSGPNTLRPYAENSPDRIIQSDDILIVDLGPVFEAWETDFGRTFVLGDDPNKKRLLSALDPMWEKVK